ncbi:hypothetical protein SESBI_25419 [Sesbania bispinosa]|nr:hypothetical protein SESBI_25419 [Sesbania bispinosa]
MRIALQSREEFQNRNTTKKHLYPSNLIVPLSQCSPHCRPCSRHVVVNLHRSAVARHRRFSIAADPVFLAVDYSVAAAGNGYHQIMELLGWDNL